MRDERLNYLSILSIKNVIFRSITNESNDEGITEYARLKCRRQFIG